MQAVLLSFSIAALTMPFSVMGRSFLQLVPVPHWSHSNQSLLIEVKWAGFLGVVYVFGYDTQTRRTLKLGIYLCMIEWNDDLVDFMKFFLGLLYGVVFKSMGEWKAFWI